jgi:hypothetical protein
MKTKPNSAFRLHCTRADKTINAPSTSGGQKGSETLSEKGEKKKKRTKKQSAISTIIGSKRNDGIP